MIAQSVQQIALLGSAGLLCWAAASDLIHFRIANRVSLAIAALYPTHLLAGWLAGAPVDWTGGFMAGAVVFAAGFAIFNLGLVGGGDVKLLSAVALWSGLSGLVQLLVVVGIAGGLLSIGLIASKAVSFMRQPTQRPEGMPMWRALLQQPAPYGVAIAAGGLFVLGRLAGLRLAF